MCAPLFARAVHWVYIHIGRSIIPSPMERRCLQAPIEVRYVPFGARCDGMALLPCAKTPPVPNIVISMQPLLFLTGGRLFCLVSSLHITHLAIAGPAHRITVWA